MTGICGIWHRDGRDASADCSRMRRALKVYGPYREGAWDGGPISLGLQLYRMLPEDRFDKQPLAGGGGRFVLVADVRLDNRSELAAELGWSSERTRTAADADYVLAAWEKWQDASLDKLIGDWALAVWNAEKHTLTLARDMMGMRPLFYHAGKDFFAFASMVKGLHALSDIPIAPDLDTLRDYLAAIPLGSKASFYEKISMVEPGGKAVLHADGRIEAGCWYDWSALGEREVTDDAACIEEFRSLFDRVVADRLRTTGGVASHLSSGFDSTAVTVTAARILAEKDRRLTAYTHVPVPGLMTELPGRLCDEGPAAAATAAQFANIDHILIDAGDRPIGEGLDAAWYYQETPNPQPEHQAWREISQQRMRSRGETVLLAGSMGNYTISWDGRERLHQALRRGEFKTWLHEARALCRTDRMRPLSAVYQTIYPWLPAGLDRALQRLRGKPRFELRMVSALNPQFFADRAFRKALDAALDRFKPNHGNRECLLPRLKHEGLAAGIYKGMLAASGVEQRDPTADRRLMEFSLSLPSRFWLRDGQPKWLYRQAFRGRVPQAVMDRHERGFIGGDYPERLRRSKPLLDAEIVRALNNPAMRKLADVDFLSEFVSHPLPSPEEI